MACDLSCVTRREHSPSASPCIFEIYEIMCLCLCLCLCLFLDAIGLVFTMVLSFPKNLSFACLGSGTCWV